MKTSAARGAVWHEKDRIANQARIRNGNIGENVLLREQCSLFSVAGVIEMSAFERNCIVFNHYTETFPLGNGFTLQWIHEKRKGEISPFIGDGEFHQ